MSLEGDVRHLEMLPEVRPDVVRDHAPIIGLAGRSQAREVFLLEARDQIHHRGRGALGLEIAQGIAALVDQLPQLAALARAAVVLQSGNWPMV